MIETQDDNNNNQLNDLQLALDDVNFNFDSIPKEEGKNSRTFCEFSYF